MRRRPPRAVQSMAARAIDSLPPPVFGGHACGSAHDKGRRRAPADALKRPVVAPGFGVPSGKPRGVRSFVRREGRMTPAQRRAIEMYWPAYGLDVEGMLDFPALFGRDAPATLEIGFGNGENLLEMAVAEPGQNFLGVEVYRPGIGRLLHAAHAAGVANLKVMYADVVEAVSESMADASLSRVLILFPDPWPKRKHRKRRLLTPAFIATLAAKTSAGGLLHLATDRQDYAEQIRWVVAMSGYFEPVGGARPCWRRRTHFEIRGDKAGRKITDLPYRRI